MRASFDLANCEPYEVESMHISAEAEFDRLAGAEQMLRSWSFPRSLLAPFSVIKGVVKEINALTQT